eukprot:3589478-Pyramimonas_sp.AAC.1
MSAGSDVRGSTGSRGASCRRSRLYPSWCGPRPRTRGAPAGRRWRRSGRRSRSGSQPGLRVQIPLWGELLPTFGRWMPCSQPRPRPADIEECGAAELASWETGGFASPPCQLRGKWCLHWADDRVEPPDARIREKLM